MTRKYKEALSEVDFILNQLDKNDLEKIPENFRSFISENKSSWHEISEIANLYEETYAILAIIYRKFLAEPEERIELEKEYQEKLKQEKEELKRLREKNVEVANTEIKYDFVNNDIKQEVQEEITELVEYKQEKWYIKIMDKLKKVFHIK